jgi:ADP-ribose pyrophosphatase YjhB (NUDIX family)
MSPITRIIPAARAVVLDREGRVLLIRRGDNKMWALPAGTMEPGESVTECMKREVREETGLVVQSATAFAVYSEPRFRAPSSTTAQLLTVAFKVNERTGELKRQTDETTDARFFTLDELQALPDLMPMYLECIEDCLRSDGTVIVK